MTSHQLEDELAYIKSLAEQGSIGPMRNGISLLAAGLAYAGAAVAQYFSVLGVLPRTGWMALTIWGGATLVFWAVAATTWFRKSKSHNQSVGLRAKTSVWSAVGMGILALLLCVTIIANVMKDVAAISFMIAPVILIMYGIGWWVSAKVSAAGWIRWIAIGCFVAAPLITFLAGRPEQLLAYAVCLILFAAVPGGVVMRAERT